MLEEAVHLPGKPETAISAKDVVEAIERLRNFGQTHRLSLGGMTIRELAPPGASMTGIVIDASVTLAWCFPAGPVQICRDHRRTPYDALYVELAMRSAYRLATLDQPQRDAAKALGVHCL